MDDARVDHDRPLPVRAAPVPPRAADGAPAGDEDERGEDGEAEGSNLVLVDGSNVAHAGEGSAARLANILLVRDRLMVEGNEVIVVADAALRHQIDDADGYERMVESGMLKQAPAGTDADYFLLAFARELGASILSNDRFKDRVEHFPEARDRVIRYMIVADEVVFERRTHRRGRK